MIVKVYYLYIDQYFRSVSALTVSKQYTASPKKFDPSQEERRKKLSKQNSKKNSVASSDGYQSDTGTGRGRVNSVSRRLAGHRMTLMERQNLYAKSRSNSEEPRSPRTRSVSPARRRYKFRYKAM